MTVRVRGSAGYFCAGLTDGPRFEVDNNVGWGLADNMYRGTIVVGGNERRAVATMLGSDRAEVTVPVGRATNDERRDAWIDAFERRGWDTVNANLPQAEMADLIIELRSLTQGTGTFRYEFDHLQELAGREADEVIAQRQEAKAAA